MTLTNYDIYNLYEILLSLKNNKLSIYTSFKIVYNLKILSNIYNSINEIKLDILTPFITNKNEVIVPPDKITEVNQQLSELSQIAVTVDLHKIKLHELEFTNLSVEEIEKLFPILEE